MSLAQLISKNSGRDLAHSTCLCEASAVWRLFFRSPMGPDLNLFLIVIGATPSVRALVFIAAPTFLIYWIQAWVGAAPWPKREVASKLLCKARAFLGKRMACIIRQLRLPASIDYLPGTYAGSKSSGVLVVCFTSCYSQHRSRPCSIDSGTEEEHPQLILQGSPRFSFRPSSFVTTRVKTWPTAPILAFPEAILPLSSPYFVTLMLIATYPCLR